MKDIKRVFTLALALTLALTLAACGGGNTTPPASNTPSGGNTNSPAPPPSDNGGNPGVTPTDGNGNGGTKPISIPDNGTPPDVPAPFEAHSGDKGYFYVDTDDYAVFMYDISNEPKNIAYPYAPCVQYTVVSFDSTDYTSIFNKWVFESEANAASFANEDTYRIAIGNVVYVDTGDLPTEAYQGVGKEYHIRLRYGNTVWVHGGSVYLSKPAGFEELLADTGMKGKTGSMTLREAFADAGITSLPDAPGLDYDAVTNFILTFKRDNHIGSLDANFMVFDGETGIKSGRFFFFDDPAKATQYQEFQSPPDQTKSYYIEYLPDQTRGGGNLCYVGVK